MDTWKTEVVRLYVEEQNSANTIAKKFNTTGYFIYKALDEAQVTLRSRGVWTRTKLPRPPLKTKTCRCCAEDFIPAHGANVFCRTCTEGTRAGISCLNEYGITLADVRELTRQQDTKCAICSRDFSSLRSRQVHVDHDHFTGRVRGIICARCNQRLSGLEDPKWKDAAERYLTRPGLMPRISCCSTLQHLKVAA